MRSVRFFITHISCALCAVQISVEAKKLQQRKVTQLAHLAFSKEDHVLGAVAAAGDFDDFEDASPDGAYVVVAVEHDGEVGLVLTPIEGEARCGHGALEEGGGKVRNGVRHADGR